MCESSFKLLNRAFFYSHLVVIACFTLESVQAQEIPNPWPPQPQSGGPAYVTPWMGAPMMHPGSAPGWSPPPSASFQQQANMSAPETNNAAMQAPENDGGYSTYPNYPGYPNPMQPGYAAYPVQSGYPSYPANNPYPPQIQPQALPQNTSFQPGWNQPVLSAQLNQSQQIQPMRQPEETAVEPKPKPSVYHPEMIPMRKDSAFRFNESKVSTSYGSHASDRSGNESFASADDTPQARFENMLRQRQEEKRSSAAPSTASWTPSASVNGAELPLAHASIVKSTEEIGVAAMPVSSMSSADVPAWPAQNEKAVSGEVIQELQEKVRQLETERDGLRAFVQTLMVRIEKTQKIESEWSKLMREKDELRAMFHAMEEEVDQARKAQYRVTELEAERDRIQANLEKLEAQLAKSGDAKNKIEELEIQKREMRAILGNIQQGESETEGLRVRIANLEAERDRLKTALDQRAQMELGTVSLAVQEKMHQLEAENVELKKTIERLNLRVQTLTEGNVGGQELADLDAAIHATDLTLEQARQIERSETALREAKQTAAQTRKSILKAQAVEPAASLQKSSLLKEEQKQSVVQKIIIQGGGAMLHMQENANSEAQNDAVIVEIPQLPKSAIDGIRETASHLIGRVFTVDEARRLGQKIGTTLQELGLTQYDVVLPKQDLSHGVILVEVRPST